MLDPEKTAIKLKACVVYKNTDHQLFSCVSVCEMTRVLINT